MHPKVKNIVGYIGYTNVNKEVFAEDFQPVAEDPKKNEFCH